MGFADTYSSSTMLFRQELSYHVLYLFHNPLGLDQAQNKHNL